MSVDCVHEFLHNVETSTDLLKVNEAWRTDNDEVQTMQMNKFPLKGELRYF